MMYLLTWLPLVIHRGHHALRQDFECREAGLHHLGHVVRLEAKLDECQVEAMSASPEVLSLQRQILEI
jgi:hypothetical protein